MAAMARSDGMIQMIPAWSGNNQQNLSFSSGISDRTKQRNHHELLNFGMSQDWVPHKPMHPIIFPSFSHHFSMFSHHFPIIFPCFPQTFSCSLLNKGIPWSPAAIRRRLRQQEQHEVLPSSVCRAANLMHRQLWQLSRPISYKCRINVMAISYIDVMVYYFASNHISRCLYNSMICVWYRIWPTSGNTSLLQAAAPRGEKWSCPGATGIECWSVLNLAGLVPWNSDIVSLSIQKQSWWLKPLQVTLLKSASIQRCVNFQSQDIINMEFSCGTQFSKPMKFQISRKPSKIHANINNYTYNHNL